MIKKSIYCKICFKSCYDLLAGSELHIEVHYINKPPMFSAILAVIALP